MKPDEIRAVFTEEIGNIAPEADLARLSGKADFRDELDIDSIGFLNLIIAIGKRLQVDVPEKDYVKLATVDGAVAYLAGARRK